jgi:hypothetical protein
MLKDSYDGGKSQHLLTSHGGGGWKGKKKFPESLQHFSQLKMHRSFDHGVDAMAQ